MTTTSDDHAFPTCAICLESEVEDAGDHADSTGHWPTALQATGETLAAIRAGLGLSRADLAEHLDVSFDSVKSWENDRRGVPAGVWGEIRALEKAQEEEIRHHIEEFTARPNTPATLYIETGPEARPVGWQRAVAARVHRVVPRVGITSDKTPQREDRP